MLVPRCSPVFRYQHGTLSNEEDLTLNTVAVTPDPQVNAELEIPHEPLDDFNVNPEP